MSISTANKMTIDAIYTNDDQPNMSIQQTEKPYRATEVGPLVYDETAQQYKRVPDAKNPAPFPVKVLKRAVDASATVLQNAIEAAADGDPYTLNGKDKLILAITGTATERTVEFKVIGPGSVEGYVLGSKIGSDGSITLAASTSATTDEIWEFEGMAGYTSFYAKVTTLTGAATVTCLGVA
jgi:hypothetical protein